MTYALPPRNAFTFCSARARSRTAAICGVSGHSTVVPLESSVLLGVNFITPSTIADFRSSLISVGLAVVRNINSWKHFPIGDNAALIFQKISALIFALRFAGAL